jgi:hypothetical protein
MDDKYENLIRRITSIGFDINTDFPSSTQVEGNRDGVLVFCAYEEDEDGYFTGETREYTGTFADAIQEAINSVVAELTIEGLTRNEAMELLLSPEYRAKTFELAEICEPFEGLLVNTTRFKLEDGGLVNEDFGKWPFDDE